MLIPLGAIILAVSFCATFIIYVLCVFTAFCFPNMVVWWLTFTWLTELSYTTVVGSVCIIVAPHVGVPGFLIGILETSMRTQASCARIINCLDKSGSVTLRIFL